MDDFRDLFNAPAALKAATDDCIAYVAFKSTKPMPEINTYRAAMHNLRCHMREKMGITVSKTGKAWVKTEDYPEGLLILWGYGKRKHKL